MKMIEITESDIETQRRKFWGFVSYKTEIGRKNIKFRRVYKKKQKYTKVVSEFYGELATYKGVIKAILPLGVTTEDGDERRLKKGYYFMGREPIELSNPIKLKHLESVMYDIKYKGLDRNEDRNQEEHIKLREYQEDDLEQKHIGYFKGCSAPYNQNGLQNTLFKKVSERRGKKEMTHFYGEIITYAGEVKVLLPMVMTTEQGNELRLRNGLYFMGKTAVELRNPRKLIYAEVVMYDIDYKY